jgi:cysteine-rich repeat protein
MRFRTVAIAAALSAGFAPHKGAEPPIVAATRAPRLHRDVAWTAPAGALAQLAGWRVMWDRDTDVPLRLWGPALSAPRATGDAAVAVATARGLLVQHLSLLAPGASASDFTPLANVIDRSGARTVSFAQHHAGVPVVGGAIAFTFKHDKLTLISSTALPHVTVRMPAGSLPPATLASAARTWLGDAGHAVDVKAIGERVILPIVRSRGTNARPDIEYRVAETVEVEGAREPGAWQVWLDAGSAAPIARRSTIYFASGTVLYDTPDRYPGGARTAKPAATVTHTIDSMPVTSALDGSITWAGEAAATVSTGLVGPLVRLTNKAGALASEELTLAPGGSVTWSGATDEYVDAQLTAFIAASMAKQFAQEHLAPDLAWLNSQIPVVVNEQQTCNAFSTGNAIHFYKASAPSTNGSITTQCENTARLVDVVYHEFGHSLHRNSIIPGQGSWDGALSEGLSDTLAQAITGDPGMGRGFFMSDAPLRHLDPAGRELRWPDDVTGQVHDDGEIIGGTLWDLRVALEQSLGQEAGYAQFLAIFYSIMQRAADIPSSYVEALLADDDDGDLANGTPNQCTIDRVFGMHGLADPTVSLGLEPPSRAGNRVSITVRPRQAQLDCPAPAVTSGTLTWRVRGGGEASDIALAAAGETWAGNIPTQPEGAVVLYTVRLELADGSTVTYPQNAADREYQFYVGNVEKLWCTDFESGEGGWTFGASVDSRMEWEVGEPRGIGGDPATAHSGSSVLGIDLGLGSGPQANGMYRSRTKQWAISPEIELAGHTQVRLQYYRWLNVEDALYDKAMISANDAVVWTNYASQSQNSNGRHHTDREWRFHDVDLSAHTAGGTIQLKFQLDSDEGLELAGWTIDDVCLVIAGPPAGTCGNFNVDEGETCDDGNTADGDACPSDCGASQLVDSGCCSAGHSPAGPLALSLLTLGLVARRRRRR